MVSRRFSSFVLGLVLLFLALVDSLAYTHQATKKIMANENSLVRQGESPSTIEKENFVAEKRKFAGRKMIEKKGKGKEEGKNGEGSSKISGANSSVGNCSSLDDHKGEGQLKIECKKLSVRSSVKVEKMGDFVAFSADYNRRNVNVSKKPLGASEEHMHDQNDTNMSKPKTFPKFQSEKLDDHQNPIEIENIMNKDYSGAVIPHPKPPINNYQPLHHHQHKVLP
ncbi:unnamed protein product [Camellia sinensis]